MNSAALTGSVGLRSESFTGIDAIGGSAWDDLVERAYTSTVFQTAGWVKAWQMSLGIGQALIIPAVYQYERLVGAAVLQEQGGLITFGAADRADYGDLLIDRDLHPELQREVACQLLQCAQQAASRSAFMFDKVPSESRSMELLATLQPGFYCVPLQQLPAPRMDMSVVDERLKKKSLKRHENGLKRMGEVTFTTHSEARDILPKLEAFFAQHVERWRDTPSPSLFNDQRNREFYVELTRQMDGSGVLRYSELTLDGALVAVHFGFLFGGAFIWYKPAFDVAYAKNSPGEVLISNLLRQAKSDGADIFDFTIGGEAFKYRFATSDPTVTRLYLTDSRAQAALRDVRRKTAKLVERVNTQLRQLREARS